MRIIADRKHDSQSKQPITTTNHNNQSDGFDCYAHSFPRSIATTTTAVAIITTNASPHRS
jgi:hypothetical protein